MADGRALHPLVRKFAATCPLGTVYILGKKLLAPVLYFAETVSTGLLAVSAE